MTVFACNCLLIILLFFTLTEGIGFTKWMNAIFYITALNMIFFLYLLILKGKFFDGITHSFQRLLNKSKEDDYQLPSETVNLPVYNILKFNFLSLGMLLLTMQILYFTVF